MNRNHSLDESREQAALYTVGALPDEERSAFEQHRLVDGCDVCAAEVAGFAPVVEHLAFATPLQTPPQHVRERILQQAVAQGMSAAHPTIDKDQLRFVSAECMDWKPGNAPGIEMKVLSVDKERGFYTTLVRMAPGSSLARHRHVGLEESYVIEGELLVSGVLMRPGDYCRAEVGSMHVGVTTKTGCVFIAVASLHDEWFLEA